MIHLRPALRSLLKTPAVTAIAVLSLALGIGANAAIFSLFEQMLLRPLPVAEPDRLVNLLSPGPKPGSQSTGMPGGMDSVFSYPMFRDLEAAESSLQGIAGHRPFGASLAFNGDTVGAGALLVSGSYFPVLGLKPAVGRLFTEDDDRTPGNHPQVVLSHDYWKSRFGARSDVVGEALVVNGHPMTIIGVAPDGFQGTTIGSQPKVFVPLVMRDTMMPGWSGFERRNSYWLYLIGRLGPDSTLEQALASLNPTYRNLIQNVELAQQEGMSEAGLERFRNKELAMEPGWRGQSNMHQEVRAPLLVLLAVTGLVVLIAAANLANLLLVRASSRSGEIAVRLAIGARRGHVVSQLLVESFLLAVLGCALGLFVAEGTIYSIARLLPEQTFDLGLDYGPALWLFLALLTLVTGLAGLVPALTQSKGNLMHALRAQTGQSSGSRSAIRFRSAMATLQIGLAVALLGSSGLFLRSLMNVSRVDLGLEVEQLATFAVSPQRIGYTEEQCTRLFERLEDEIAALPGISSAAGSLVPLVANSSWGNDVKVQGFETGPDIDDNSRYTEIGPGFFSTVGMNLLSGREFKTTDRTETPKVAIVNETFAEKFGLGREAVGKWMSNSDSEELDIQIVGLVQDAAYNEVKGSAQPVYYLPYRQTAHNGRLHFYVRTLLTPEQSLQTLRRVVSRLEPNLPIEGLRTMRVQVQENIFLDRLLSTLSAAFAIVATLLAAIGLYGVMAYSVSQRKREIGLRMALGADSQKVRSMVLRQVSRMALVGGTLGLAAAFAIGRVARSLLFELQGHDPAVLGSAVAVIGSVALGAGMLPAQRAAQVDPMRALRDE